MVPIIIAKGEPTYHASDQTLVPAFKDAQSTEHQQANEGELGNVPTTPTTSTDSIYMHAAYIAYYMII